MTIHQQAATRFPLTNTYARLPERFFARLSLKPVSAPRLVRLNAQLAQHLGLDPEVLASRQGVEILSGNRLPEGAEPIAQAYAGHQFGNWVPKLGDGRAMLLGEVIDRDGLRRDIQLKGSGQTPFSRMGDGRAWLGPVLREYIVSEAMAALGVPTTRALAVVTTGEDVVREQVFPGAILTRVAQSHVRVGTFQYFAARGDVEALKMLADYVIERHDPDAKGAAHPYRTLLEAVVARQAYLVAHWQAVGFIHGVMNTDNMSIAGETIDYGPCAFMDTYHPQTVFSSIDLGGRYAYANQPGIAQWNLATFAQSLLPLLDQDEDQAIAFAQATIDAFPGIFADVYMALMRAKLGLERRESGDLQLADDLLACMAQGKADFTLVFRRLSEVSFAHPHTLDAVRALFADPASVDDWLDRWRNRLELETSEIEKRMADMQRANPLYIPRNHLVEAAIQAAAEREDFAPFEQLTNVLSSPFAEQSDCQHFGLPPKPDEVVHQTFCGT